MKRIFLATLGLGMIANVAAASAQGNPFGSGQTDMPWSVNHPTLETSGIAALAEEAASAFDVYGVNYSRAVEFGATDKAQLVRRIASQIGRTVSVPDLTASGYSFMGGRLVATPHGAAGLMMYSNGRGQRLLMLVRPMAIDQDTRMSEHSYGDINGFTWAIKGMGFSLVGPAPADLLHPIANEARRQEGETI
jgi:anti-sigma factor RsiW